MFIKLLKKRKKYLLKINDFFNVLNYFNTSYISKTQYLKLKRIYKPLYTFFKNSIKNKSIRNFLKIYSNFESYIENHNSIYIKNELILYENLLNNIDGKSLDFQQKQAVLSDEKNNLIIAGAGSGKTLTISGKVKYLIESNKATTDEILLISFTDKATKEMTERLNRIDINLKAKTFHKLGLDIIKNFTRFYTKYCR